jgi:acyl-CoA dehydrogenase
VRTRARRVSDAQGEGWVLDGQKVFITNGQIADLYIVVAKTDPAAGARGVSLFLVPHGTPGFTRGRRLEKVGMHAQDTSELFFEGARLPADALLGEEGQGFAALMQELPQERLLVAITAVAATEEALRLTLAHVAERQAFGAPLSALQTIRHKLAECKTEVAVSRAFLEQCIARHLQGALTTEDASMAKYWCTEMQFRVTDACLQLFGGWGYMREFPISRLWADARVQRIYGGTTEIMKEIIGRRLF